MPCRPIVPVSGAFGQQFGGVCNVCGDDRRGAHENSRAGVRSAVPWIRGRFPAGRYPGLEVDQLAVPVALGAALASG